MISQKHSTIKGFGVFFSNVKQCFVENIFENLPAVKEYLGTPLKKKKSKQFLEVTHSKREGERVEKKERGREIIEFND